MCHVSASLPPCALSGSARREMQACCPAWHWEVPEAFSGLSYQYFFRCIPAAWRWNPTSPWMLQKSAQAVMVIIISKFYRVFALFSLKICGRNDVVSCIMELWEPLVIALFEAWIMSLSPPCCPSLPPFHGLLRKENSLVAMEDRFLCSF